MTSLPLGMLVTSYEHFGQTVGSGAGDERFDGMESHVIDGFVEFLPMRGDLLDARLRVKIP